MGQQFSNKDAAYGALLGALVGDAAGGVLEFMGRRPTEQEVEAAMRMPGGGCWRLGKGQITDDTELALCLAQALMQHTPQAGAPPPLDNIAYWYGRWITSRPFDIGNTCRASMPVGTHGKGPEPGLGAKMAAAAAKRSIESKANGALMRVMPLAVWAHRLDDETIASCAAQDAALSHPSPACQAANAAYCIAMAHLIRSPGDADGAVTRAAAWLQKCGNEEVQTWFIDSAQPEPAVHYNAGFVKWAFKLTFWHLRQRSSYEAAMRHVLSLGGDVDTNAAIVGGVIGALNGASTIPEFMAGPVLSRSESASHDGPERPDFLQGSILPAVFEQLYERALAAAPSGCH